MGLKGTFSLTVGGAGALAQGIGGVLKKFPFLFGWVDDVAALTKAAGGSLVGAVAVPSLFLLKKGIRWYILSHLLPIKYAWKGAKVVSGLALQGVKGAAIGTGMALKGVGIGVGAAATGVGAGIGAAGSLASAAFKHPLPVPGLPVPGLPVPGVPSAGAVGSAALVAGAAAGAYVAYKLLERPGNVRSGWKHGWSRGKIR